MRKLFWVLLGVAAVPVSGVIYQKLCAWSDRRRYCTLGRLVRLPTSTVYLYDVGPLHQDSTTGVTVLFESGIGATSQNWIAIQRAIAAHSRAVSYDRAGLGWSSAATCTPTPEHLAGELRALLAESKISGPYLLVAHSFGGLVARRFAADYPADVLGLVLVDPMRPDDWPPLADAAEASVSRGIRLARGGHIAACVGLSRLFMRSTLLGSRRIARLLCRIGGEPTQNLMERILCEVGKMPPEVWPSVVANWSRPQFYRTVEAYLRSIPETAIAMHAAPPLSLPVTVLTPITATPLTNSQLRAISSNAQQLIAPASAHWIHLDEPELVLAAIRELLANVALPSETSTVG